MPTVPLVNSAFVTADPVTPAWLEQLQDKWVDPTEFLDLWRPNGQRTFPALYVKGKNGWQRLWRNGQGRPRKMLRPRQSAC